ncbi:MAG: hypothetical protein ACLUFN_07710 [Eubacterium sp.]
MKCLKCGHECPNTAKFCEECGQTFIETDIQSMDNQNNNRIPQTRNKGCLRVFVIVLVIILAITCIVKISNKSDENARDNTIQNETIEIPDEVELITYSERVLEDEFGNAEFSWLDYYNTVSPKNGSLKAKVEGSAYINDIKHQFTLIIEFTNETYKNYDVKYLQVDDTEIYNYE